MSYYPSLQDLNFTSEQLTEAIQQDLKKLKSAKASLEEAKARLQSSSYADAVECQECGGEGRIGRMFQVGYDDYEADTELCECCLLEGVYPWDVNREWFDEEAAKATLDPSLDEDEREDELRDLLEDQAYDLDLSPPLEVKEWKQALHHYSFLPYNLHQNLSILKDHNETETPSWVDKALIEVEALIEKENP